MSRGQGSGTAPNEGFEGEGFVRNEPHLMITIEVRVWGFLFGATALYHMCKYHSAQLDVPSTLFRVSSHPIILATLRLDPESCTRVSDRERAEESRYWRVSLTSTANPS